MTPTLHTLHTLHALHSSVYAATPIPLPMTYVTQPTSPAYPCSDWDKAYYSSLCNCCSSLVNSS